MKLGTHPKQPVEIKDYPIDYRDWLAEVVGSDWIVAATASVECLTDPLDTALAVDRVDFAAGGVSPWLSGGTDGQRYKVTVNVTTNGGRLDQSEFIVKVKDC